MVEYFGRKNMNTEFPQVFNFSSFFAFNFFFNFSFLAFSILFKMSPNCYVLRFFCQIFEKIQLKTLAGNTSLYQLGDIDCTVVLSVIQQLFLDLCKMVSTRVIETVISATYKNCYILR